MRRVNFDLDALRSFSVGTELGSFAKAADQLGRSTSAVSAQLKKLEEQAGVPILRKAGRGMALTEAGEMLLSYARRMLLLNDEAALAITGRGLEGWVRIGLQEDFSDGLLTDVLGKFTRSHPGIRVEARVGRNAEIAEQVAAGSLDLALLWQVGEASGNMTLLGSHDVCWIGPANMPVTAWRDRSHPLPLVAFEAPCMMRAMAIDALDEAGIPWHVAFTSASLSGIWAAVSAGLGVAVRTAWGMPPGVKILSRMDSGLPELPAIGIALHFAPGARSTACERLAEVIVEHTTNISPRAVPGRIG